MIQVSRFLSATRVHCGRSSLLIRLDRVKESLCFKGLLKRAVGTQHFNNVEEIESSNHVTATGDRDNIYVGKFSSQLGGSPDHPDWT